MKIFMKLIKHSYKLLDTYLYVSLDVHFYKDEHIKDNSNEHLGAIHL